MNNSGPYTPLYVACEKGLTNTAHLLINRGADLHTTRSWKTPLLVACENGHTEAAQLLIDSGADVNKTGSWKTPLHVACEKGHTEIAQFLTDRGANIDSLEDDYASAHKTFVHRATLDDNYETKGSWKTPLHLAVENGHTQTAQLLIDRGADVNKTGSWKTPLHVACEKGHTEIAQFLTDRGANIDSLEDDYASAHKTFVHRATLDDNYETKGSWKTPLHLAVENGHTQTAQLLIDRGADVNRVCCS